MNEIQKAYEPAAVEDKWYRRWIENHDFTADPTRVSGKRPAYSIVIPPPNVTGVLTMGHVLNNTIQDLLARKARMDGKEVLWLPGTDHAGIATQTVVEKTLKKQGLIRHRDDLGREKFLDKVWEWKAKHGDIIIQQLKRLGASCDWSRERFTMDRDYTRCVQRVFVDLYQKGLIYRGKRMVNWCPISLTALSDEEVVMKEQHGLLYYFKVEIAEEPGVFLTIATTRPETIPGDTAIAVNPKDPRYTRFIGKHAIRPLPVQIPLEKKLIPIIGDAQVDFEFGTGVLKVTPAHDKADFEIGHRHGLPQVDIMNPDGTMNALAGESLVGLDRFEARANAVEHLRELGALVKDEAYTNKVGFSERADVPVEPRLSEQWFLKYPSQESSRRCVVQEGEPATSQPPAASQGRIQFHPQRWAKVYDHWMGNLQDWCISRQLWWGHRIPVWYRKSGAIPLPSGVSGVRRPDPATATAAERTTYVGIEPPTDPENWEQDPDVLDTWFSSWLWPFATMGWPDKTPTLNAFYPTTDLVTGPDIIFFWVARMIAAGFEYMGDVPFRNVYFTGIIRDKQGRKMSKSLGNSPDPLDLIARYGADALRFGTMRSAPLGQDVLFDEQNVELGRNFCNKLWNACRFRQMAGSEGTQSEAEIEPSQLDADDRWIMLRLHQAITEVTTAFTEYKFSDATAALYRFFWSEYCDWYIEASKAALGPFRKPDAAPEPLDPTQARLRANKLAVIDFVLNHTLRLFHPFLPFITEELWHGLGFNTDLPDAQGGRTILFAPWPKPFSTEELEYFDLSEDAWKVAAAKYELVSLARNLKAQFNIPSSKRVAFVFRPGGFAPTPADLKVLGLLLNAERLDVRGADWMPPQGTPMAANDFGELHLPIEGVVDTAAERARLAKETARIDAEIEKVRNKLNNPNFTQKVPPQVLEEHRQRLMDWEAKRRQTEMALASLGGSQA